MAFCAFLVSVFFCISSMDPQRHGKYVPAKEARIEYGNPLRLVWVRTADHKVWEVDARDGDHLGGFHRDDG